MVDYVEVPDANKLVVESQNCVRAIQMIDAGGTVASFVVTGPPAPTPPVTAPVFPVNITLPGPAQPAVVAQARASLVDRVHDIVIELEGMGVTIIPPEIRDVE